MLYPWQQQQWQQIQAQRQDNRLPHALLLTGPNGLGKLDFARHLVAAILCTQVDSSAQACGQCPSCCLFKAGTHPDYFTLQPEEEDKAIKVDDIRALCRSFTLTSQLGGYKLVVIEQADNMNINAANSLLKTLEEPSASSVLILVSSKPYRLPVTVRSRCQNIRFQLPETRQAETWLAQHTNSQNSRYLLQLAHGSPLLAVKLADDELMAQRKSLMDALLGVANNRPLTEFTEHLSKLPKESLLGWLQDWICDLIKLRQCGADASLVHADYSRQLNQLSQQIDPKGLFGFLDDILKYRRFQSIALNSQMLWEDLLITWEKQSRSHLYSTV